MPPDLPTLRALENRLERATGASRDLDQAIMVAVAGWRLLGPYVGPNGSSMVLVDDKGKAAREPELSGSIDAAVALCERVLGKNTYTFSTSFPCGFTHLKWWADEKHQRMDDPILVDSVGQVADQPPIAIILALVRALIARAEHA